MILQFQQRFQCPAIALESKAAHQVGRFTGILCGEQLLDQTIPHIGGSVIIELLHRARTPLRPVPPAGSPG